MILRKSVSQYKFLLKWSGRKIFISVAADISFIDTSGSRNFLIYTSRGTFYGTCRPIVTALVF